MAYHRWTKIRLRQIIKGKQKHSWTVIALKVKKIKTKSRISKSRRQLQHALLHCLCMTAALVCSVNQAEPCIQTGFLERSIKQVIL